MAAVVVVFLDVGQGDCTFAVDRSTGEAILFDCPAGLGRRAIDALDSAGATRLVVGFASHSDVDHLGGLYEVVTSIPVQHVRVNLDSVVQSGVVAERTKLRAAQRAIAGLVDQAITVEPCYAGDDGRVGDIAWRALSPTHDLLLLAQGRGDRNIASVILLLESQNIRVLIGADAPTGAFGRAIERGEDIHAHVFRLSHHGGRVDQLGGLSLSELLDKIGAELHVISVGSGNAYGHPTRETLEVLGKSAYRARVMCTQVNQTCAGGSRMPDDMDDAGLPGLARLGSGGRGGGCRCAGSIWLEVRDEGWFVSPTAAEHGSVIDTLERPMCRAYSRPHKDVVRDA